MKGLPEGWASAALGEIGDWRGGGTPSKSVPAYWQGEIPWVSPKDMKRPTIDDAEDRITEAAIAASAANLIPSGSVLIVTRSGILRHSLPVARTTREVAINQDLKALTPHEPASAEFVTWYVRAEAQAILRACAKAGTTVDSIDFDRLKLWSIAVPPLAEQRRIVAKLDALTARTARARADLDRIPALAERYKQAIRQAAVDGDLLETRRAAERRAMPLKSAIARIRTGPFGSSLHKHEYVQGGVPLINPMHINDGRITPSPQMSVTQEKAAALGDFRLSSGDVVIARRGVMGRCAVVRDAEADWLIGTGSMAITPGAALDSEFLQLFLSSPTVVAALEANAVGSTMVNLNQGVLLKLEIRLPELDEQREVVSRVSTAFAEIDRLTAEAAAARRLLDRLDQAILARAFRGELVPQDPADEPASVLLERIRAERAAAPKPKRGRRKAAA